MRDVAVVGFAQRQMREFDGSPNCVELLVPILAELWEQTGWSKTDIAFWCSGSSDYLAGRSFSFVTAIDALGAVPPISESHVEMDAAWALYEAWVKLLCGEVDTALVYGFGKSSASPLRRTLALQLDPYTVTPLWPDTVSIAALQARLGLDGVTVRIREVQRGEIACRKVDFDIPPQPHGRHIRDIRALVEAGWLHPIELSDPELAEALKAAIRGEA